MFKEVVSYVDTNCTPHFLDHLYLQKDIGSSMFSLHHPIAEQKFFEMMHRLPFLTEFRPQKKCSKKLSVMRIQIVPHL